jgi:hypothetical protein
VNVSPQANDISSSPPPGPAVDRSLSAMPAPAANRLHGSVWRRAMHIWMLAVLAIAAPLLGSLAERERFLLDNQIGWPVILVLVGVLVGVAPMMLAGIDATLRRLLPVRWTGLQHAVPTALLTLIGFGAIRTATERGILSIANIEMILSWAGTVLIAFLVAWLLDRVEWLRQWCSAMCLFVAIFPASFLMKYARMRPPAAPVVPATAAPSNPVPVVLIVFDEFNGTSIMTPDLQIDAERYPQLGRLAGMSTWYRNASGVHERTDVAVPAILTGRFPVAARKAPTRADYPENLFSWIGGMNSHEEIIFEPVGRLSEDTVQYAPPTPVREQFAVLAHTLPRVLVCLLFTENYLVPLPDLPATWYGLPAGSRVRRDHVRGIMRYPWNLYRTRPANHFLQCLTPGQKPLFAFLHLPLPHCPWSMLPSGNHYIGDDCGCPAGEIWPEEPEVSRLAWLRYLLQLGYVDQYVGRVLDRLQEQQMLDECLLIVTADHGASFLPGHSRRAVDSDSLPDIVSVPLFVKLPHQKIAAVSDRNVQSVDILPTIAAALGIPSPTAMDGQSFLDDRVPAPLHKTVQLSGVETVLEPVVPNRDAAIRRRVELFGVGSLRHGWPDLGPHPELVGRPLSGWTVADATGLSAKLSRFGPYSNVEAGEFVPAYLSGTVQGAAPRRRELLFALDGAIIATSWSRADEHGEVWELMLPEEIARRTDCRIELLTLNPKQPERLQKLGLIDVRATLDTSDLMDPNLTDD